jgi:hypothetical protein
MVACPLRSQSCIALDKLQLNRRLLADVRSDKLKW